MKNHQHKRHRTIQRIHKKFKGLAAAVAAATIMSGAMIPGMPAATAEAAVNPDIVKPPVTASQQVKAPNSQTAPTNFEQVLDITATAYAPGAHDNAQWGNKTFLGTEVRPGIIAVDPDVIPLGSRVYIQFPDGHGQYAVAEDTGGAIKGNRIDIAVSSVDKAYDFGIQHVKVFVLDSTRNA